MQEAAGQLAATVIAILTPYAARTAKEFVETVGETAYQKAKVLMETLKQRWTGKQEDQEASAALENFVKKPERYEPVLRDVLQEKIESDPELAGDLIRQTRDFGPIIEIVQRLKKAEHVTGLDVKEMKGGKAAVTQEIEDGRNIIGARIDRIG